MRSFIFKPRFCSRGVAFACVLFIGIGAHGQPTDSATSQTLEQQTAREVQRLALLELRMQSSPTPADYEIALRTLELAHRLTPDDPELARKMVAAAWGTGESDLLIDATRELVRVDPTDTVAQLRLITAMIARMQTADERLALYQRFLGSSAAKLNDAVRSRLALDAALLYREQGNDEQFVQMLDLALSLDGTNKAAAQIALSLYADRVGDPVGQFEMMLSLLYADPLDPNVHLSVAGVLANHGVLDQAERFFTHAVTLFDRSKSSPQSIGPSGLAMQWQLYGAQPALDALKLQLATLLDIEQRAYDYRISQGDHPDDLVSPGEVRLDPSLDRIRAMAAMATGDQESLESSMSDYAKSVDFVVKTIMDPATRPAVLDEVGAARQSVSMLIELQIYRLWTGIDVEEAKEAREQLRDSASNFEEQVGTIDPWILFSEDDYAGVLAATADFAPGSGRLIAVVRALALEGVGRTDEAANLLYQMARSDGLHPVAAWGRGYAQSLAGPIGLRSRHADGLEALAVEVPRFIDEMIVDTSTFMSFSIRSVEQPVEVGQPWHVRIRIRNVSPIPLAVGADRPINSRILLQPHKDNNPMFFFHEVYPEVVELNRRLRLEPREELDAVISVDLGATGVILALNSLSNHRIRWRALQGFVVGEKSMFRPGPMCQSAEAQSVEYRKNPMRSLPEEDVAVTIRSGSPESLLEIMQLTRSVLVAWPLKTPKPQKTVDALRDALAARFQTGSQLERAYMLAMLPTAGFEQAMVPFDTAAQNLVGGSGFRVTEYAELVEALTLITRVTDPRSPVLDDAIENASPLVATIAHLIRARLDEGRPCVARADSINDLFPPARVRAR